ncbi:MAG: BlaI/MecI/CopY family transcriptional regulator [Gemmatimonadetes bacterium]|nr:BlaI/MecI/CopY family transcriptional regulator [Gemmatimonadota bacterium]
MASFTERELDCMAVLWERGPSTVAEVREALADSLAYTTVLTVLRTLEAKGHVGHEVVGKAHRYLPLVAREAAGSSALGRIVDKIFGGSRELLLAHLVEGQGVTDDEIRNLRRVLNERLKGREAP